jgi:phosphoglycolate phosphatase
MGKDTEDQFDSIIFDLDGTLWDTCPACAIAWNNVCARNGIQYRSITADDVRAVTGKPHLTCIRETFVGLSEDLIQLIFTETIDEDNRIVSEKGGELYPGVREELHRLASRYPLYIVSNCQAGYIETFMDYTGFHPHFKDFECWGNTGKPKTDNLRNLILRNELKKPLMVGDAEGDQKAARDCGVPFAFVEYGFGKCQNSDYSYSSFKDFLSSLL